MCRDNRKIVREKKAGPSSCFIEIDVWREGGQLKRRCEGRPPPGFANYCFGIVGSSAAPPASYLARATWATTFIALSRSVRGVKILHDLGFVSSPRLHLPANKFYLSLVQISSKPAARSTFHWRFPLSNVSERNRWTRL
jgi:hypothetical protein